MHRKQKWRQFELSSQFILVIGAKIRTRDRNKFISSECCLVKKTHIIFCMLKQFSCFRMRDGNRLSSRRVELLDCPWSGYGFSTGAIPGFNPVHREAIEDFAHSLVSLSFIFLFRHNFIFLGYNWKVFTSVWPNGIFPIATLDYTCCQNQLR